MTIFKEGGPFGPTSSVSAGQTAQSTGGTSGAGGGVVGGTTQEEQKSADTNKWEGTQSFEGFRLNFERCLASPRISQKFFDPKFWRDLWKLAKKNLARKCQVKHFSEKFSVLFLGSTGVYALIRIWWQKTSSDPNFEQFSKFKCKQKILENPGYIIYVYTTIFF